MKLYYLGGRYDKNISLTPFCQSHNNPCNIKPVREYKPNHRPESSNLSLLLLHLHYFKPRWQDDSKCEHTQQHSNFSRIQLLRRFVQRNTLDIEARGKQVHSKEEHKYDYNFIYSEVATSSGNCIASKLNKEAA